MKYNFDTILDRNNTNCVKYDLREMLFSNPNVLPMWVADMDFETPDFIMDALKKRLNHAVLGYTYRGEEFYSSIIKWNKRRHNWDIKKEWISFSPGVVPALNLLTLAFTNVSDKIVVQPPVYFPFFTAITNHDRVQVDNPLKLIENRYQMDLVGLKSQIDAETKMIFICNPHNPGGNCWTKEELLELGNICVENNILIISDEIHSDLILSGFSHTPMASLSEEIANNTITLMAPSKTFNVAGLSSSFLVISNKELFDKFEKTLETIHVGSGNIFGSIAMQSAYTDGDEWLNQLLEYLQENLDFMDAYFKKYLPKVKVIKPEATYMAWLDFSAYGLSAEELNKIIIHEANVGFVDGERFGIGGDGFQRINFACPKAILKQGLNQLVDVFKDL